jgi:predicted transcriptional regulator
MAKPLSREEEDLAGLLRRLGLSRPAAACLACLLREAPATSADLAAATGLTPQAVSEGVRDLERMGLVLREPVRSEAKGRPALRHRLPASAKEALRHLEQARRKELMDELALLDELRRRAG